MSLEHAFKYCQTEAYYYYYFRPSVLNSRG